MTLLPQSAPCFYSFEKKEWAPQLSYLPCFMSQSEASIVLTRKRMWNKSFTKILLLYCCLDWRGWTSSLGPRQLVAHIWLQFDHWEWGEHHFAAPTCTGAILMLNAESICNKATHLKFTGTGNTLQRFRQCQEDYTTSLLVTFSPVSPSSLP